MTYYSALHYAAKAEAAATTATTLLPYLTDITTVATNIASVNTVSTNMTIISAVDNNLTDITTAATNIASINTVAGDINRVNLVADDISSVHTVAVDISTVIDVDNNMADINAVAGDLTNINAVAADLTNIDNASQYAAEAKQWAIGDPSEPVGNSAKYWAQQAAGQVIPSQTGHNGEYLTTDGSALSWGVVDALPEQTGQSGKFLTTDGTDASWANVDALPSQTGQSGKYLTTDGTNPSWNTITIPSVDVDGISINRNTSDELQTIGIINQNDTTTALKSWSGTKAEYDAIVTKDANTLYNITDDAEVLDTRTLGQIITSTIPLTDAGLHLLDGSVINGSGAYAGFVDYVAGLVSTYPDLFCTEADWQTSVSTYGVCGKFVYDSNTVRLPKITGFIEGTTTVSAIGDLIQAGLPNITGRFDGIVNNAPTGAFKDTGVSYTGPGGSYTRNQIDFDASQSNSIYGNSTTVQPQAIKVLYYIVIATATKTDIEVDIDQIATDLNGKADTDLGNVLANIDYVVESQLPTADNSYTWCRKYKSGWVEQGGKFSSSDTSQTQVNFPKPFADTNYTITGAQYGTAGLDQYANGWRILTLNENYAVIRNSTNGTNTYMWEAKGMGAN